MSRPLQQLEHQSKRQSHHAEEVALNAFHQRRTESLNPVGPSLIHGLTGSYVRCEQLVISRPKRNCRHVGGAERAYRRLESDRSDHMMGPALEATEHPKRVGGI